MFWSTPAMAMACVLLIVVGRLYVVAAIFAGLQLWSIASVSLRIRRDERTRQD
jgi:hypothetical protein